MVTDTYSLFYNPLVQEEEELPYLTITALEDNFQIKVHGNYCIPQYSLNGTEWNELSANRISPAINSGEKIYFKGNLEAGDNQEAYSFSTEQRFNLSGNCMSVIFGDDAQGKTDLTGYVGCFMFMFSGCAGLEKVSKNFLPATTLSENCYDAMFDGCTSLNQAPELPATTLADYCYGYMFSDCTSLVTAPELPANTLVDYCYQSMFDGCTSLNHIKMLATDVSADGCLEYWVSNVSPTGTFVKSKDAAWNVTGESAIPEGWTVETV